MCREDLNLIGDLNAGGIFKGQLLAFDESVLDENVAALDSALLSGSMDVVETAASGTGEDPQFTVELDEGVGVCLICDKTCEDWLCSTKSSEHSC